MEDFFCMLCGTITGVEQPHSHFDREKQKTIYRPKWWQNLRVTTTGVIDPQSQQPILDTFKSGTGCDSKEGYHLAEPACDKTSEPRHRTMFRWKASRYDEPFAFDVGHEGSNVLLNSMPLGDRPNGGHLYIVLHLRCINLAEKYVEAAQRKLCGPGRYLDSLAEMNDWENRGVTSLLRLFDLLIARMAESNGCGRETMDPFYHLGAELYWERHYGPYNGPYEFDDSGRGERQKICEADPFGMPRLTSSVLSNLQSQKPGTERVEVNSTDLADLRNRFSSLPTELCDIIEDYVVQKFSHNMPLRCTYILPQYFWRDKLLSGSLFPWLDDLQAQVFAEKEAELGENECWNWELLARGLSQNSMIEYNDETLTLPLGLKNRRRIWILLELARIGDNQEDDPVIGDAKIVHRRVELYDPALLQFCFSWLYPPPEDDEYC